MSDSLGNFSDTQLAAVCGQVEAADFERLSPPDEVWAGIERQLLGGEAAPVGNVTSLDTRPRTPVETPARTSDAAPTGSWVLKAAAALVLVLGIGALGGLILNGSGSDPITVAVAELADDGLPVATTAEGSAAVVCTDGTCVVELDLTEVPDPGSAILELWVIDTDVVGMHSLGEVRSSGTFDLPAGVSYEDFPIVDISVEPQDGVAAHSGQSVLRGVLNPSS